MLRKTFIAVIPLAVVIALPILFRTHEVEDDPQAEQLVIITPHNEAIRFEFEHAFVDHCRKTLGRDVDIDWRSPGGTSEIIRYIESSYVGSFRQLWTEHGNTWSAQIENAFMNRKLSPEEATEEQWRARQLFLDSTVDIGIDILFGGGQYDFGNLARKGALVPCGFRERHPELLTGDPPVLSQGLSGETWYDPEDRYYGACLSAFGLCYNLDSLSNLGYDVREPEQVLTGWSDLADPRLMGHVGAADPSKSGSITKCFEMLIQQSMAEEVNRRLPDGIDQADPAALEAAVSAGWRHAMQLVRKIGANSRYFTFSASKVPVDIAKADIAAGMCIDFYGRSQAEWEEQHVGRRTMVYVTPTGGSSISVDPIGILRGAPHRDLAEAFIDFVMSKEGQKLWNYRPGTDGGPVQYAIRRLPVRRDMYTKEHRQHMADGTAQPFELADRFVYRGSWTGRYFGLIRILVRVMIIDCHDELRDAWQAILAAGGPEKVPAAMVSFGDLPFSYPEAGAAAGRLANPPARVAATREWAAFFREKYREAATTARSAYADGGNPATGN